MNNVYTISNCKASVSEKIENQGIQKEKNSLKFRKNNLKKFKIIKNNFYFNNKINRKSILMADVNSI
jgi:hypothetical protein